MDAALLKTHHESGTIRSGRINHAIKRNNSGMSTSRAAATGQVDNKIAKWEGG